MSLGNWLHRLAVGGVALALVVGGVSYAQDDQSQDRVTPHSEKAQPKPEPPLPIAIHGPVRVELEKEVEPNWHSLKCDQAKSHDEADLCEQRRMAKAAERTVDLNAVQILVAVVGFGLVCWNLYYTRLATSAAVAAAVTAENAMFEVEAPFLYPEVTRNTISKSLGRLLDDDNTTSQEPKPASPYIYMRLKNFGNGPAVFRGWGVAAKVYAFPVTPEEFTAEVAVGAVPAIIEAGMAVPASGGAGEFRVSIEPPISAAEAREIRDGGREIVVFGRCRFAGVHGAEYEQTFSLNYHFKAESFVPLAAKYNKRSRKGPEKPEPRKWWKFWTSHPSPPPAA